MITRDADYAVRLVLDLTLRGKGTRRSIAARQGIPEGCLPRVTRALRRAGIVSGLPGRGGGLVLRRGPETISLLDVVGAIDGFLPLNRCLLEPPGCDRVAFCAAHPYWRGVQERLLEDLGGISFAEVAAAPPSSPSGPGRRARHLPSPRRRVARPRS